MPGIDETENFFRVRLRDPEGFSRLRQIPFKRSRPRIFAVVGRLRGETTTTLQSLLFPKEDGWSRDRVASWMREHPDVGKALAILDVSFKDLEAEGIVFMDSEAEETKLWEAQVLGAPAKEGDGYAVVHKTVAVQTKQVFEDEGEVDVVISSSAIDRDREVVRPEGMKVFKPKRIPLVAAHFYHDLRKHIGEIKRAKPEGEEVLARARYFTGLGNEEADWAWTLVKLGVAAYSIGFRPIKVETADLDDEKTLEQVRAGKVPIRTFVEWELVETSHVIVPSQREAVQREVAEAVTKGLIDKDLAARISRAIEEGAAEPPADGGRVDADFLERLLGESGIPADVLAEHFAFEAKQGDRWVANGARGLPLLDDDAWDAAAAVASWRRAAGAVNAEALRDRGVQRRYRRGFLVHNAAAPENFGSYKFPFVKVDGGRAKASRRGLVAARQVLAGGRNRPDVPAPTLAAAERVVNGYLGRPEDEGKGLVPAQAAVIVRLFGDGDGAAPADHVIVLDEDGQAAFRGAPVELVDALERAAGGPSEVKLAVALMVPGLKFDTSALEEWADNAFIPKLQAAIADAVRKAAPNIPADSIAGLSVKDLAEIIVAKSEQIALQVVARTAGDPDAYHTGK